MPLVSVVVPLYNKEQWVERCIKSVLEQTYKVMEILIINDGSTDNSLKIVSKMRDNRIQIINKPNGGVSSARNLGIENAKGIYITFIDADDTWESKHIEFLVKGFDTYQNAAILGNRLEETMESDKKNKVLNILNSKKSCNYSTEDYISWLSMNLFPIHIGSTMFKRSLLNSEGIRFYEHIKIGEDINFMIQVSRLGECILSDYVGLLYYHDDNNSAMNTKRTQVELTPSYFYGMSLNTYTKEHQKKIIKFLRAEYLKKAYQNRGLRFRKEEFLTKVGGGVEIGKVFLVLYLTIRYTPEFIFSLYRWIR